MILRGYINTSIDAPRALSMKYNTKIYLKKIFQPILCVPSFQGFLLLVLLFLSFELLFLIYILFQYRCPPSIKMKATLFRWGPFLKLCLLFSIIFDTVEAQSSTGDPTPQASACAFPGSGSGSSTSASRRSDSMSNGGSKNLTRRVLQSQFGPGDSSGYLRSKLQVADFMDYDDVWSMTTFEELQDEEIKTAVGTLSGCVSVAVVSRKGVYLTHHWEKPTFSPSGDFSQIGTEEFFKEHVLDVIEQGGFDAPSLNSGGPRQCNVIPHKLATGSG